MGSVQFLETEGLSEIKISEIATTDGQNKDPDTNEESFYKARGTKTIIILASFILNGIASCALGPSFVDLQLYLGCDTRMMSLVVPFQSGASLAGSFFVLFGLNRLSAEITMGLMMICTSIVTMMWASVKSIYWFLAIALLRGFIGCLNACESQPYCLQVWRNHRFQKPVVHSIHALFSLGLTIGPFIVSPFLADLNTTPVTAQTSSLQPSAEIGINSSTENQFFNASAEFENVTYDFSPWSSNAFTEYSGNVKYAFIVVGMPMLIPGILFLIVSIKNGVRLFRSTSKTSNKARNQTEILKKKTTSNLDRNILLTLTFIFYSFIAVTEFVPLTYFTLYVTTVLNWTTPQRTLINSAFYGPLCFGRILGIFLSRYFKQSTILACNVGIILSASVLLLMSTYHDAIMWLSASLLGLGISTLYGALLLWTSETINVTSRIMGAVIISFSVGAMLGPLIAGQLFAIVSPMSMVYIVLIAAIMDMLLYLTLRLLENRRIRILKDRAQKDPLHVCISNGA